MQIQITCRGATLLPYDKLVPFQGNLKSLSEENYAKLRKEIIELGFSEPLSVWHAETDAGPKHFILNGHQRHRVVQQMVEKEGMNCPPLPCNLVEAESYEQAKRKVLAFTSQYGKIEEQGLYEFMEDAKITLPEIEESFDFPDVDMKHFEQNYFTDPPIVGSIQDDEIPQSQAEVRTKLGDVYLLGDHRLVCGDATKPDDVEKLMRGERAHLCLTDPPYTVDYDKTQEARGRQYESHKHFKESEMDTHTILSFLAQVPAEVLVMTYPLDRHLFELADSLMRHSWVLRKELVWVKEAFNFQMGSKYQQQHEPILLLTKNGGSMRAVNVPANASTIFEEPRPKNHELHPTAKPVALFEKFVLYHTEAQEIVYDPFGGSGTTLVACEKNRRQARLLELSPQYCDVIVDRWEAFTGSKVKLIREP